MRTEVNDNLLPPAYVVRREGTVFTGVCLSTGGRGGPGTPPPGGVPDRVPPRGYLTGYPPRGGTRTPPGYLDPPPGWYPDPPGGGYLDPPGGRVPGPWGVPRTPLGGT